MLVRRRDEFYLERSFARVRAAGDTLVSVGDWESAGIICPHCGNRGGDGGGWETNGVTPFRLIEEVVRSWLFEPRRDSEDRLTLVADTSSDDVDWESGTNLRFECVQCFGEFPLPEGAKVEFE